MSNITFKKGLLIVICLAFLASLFLIKPKDGAFEGIGSLINSKVNGVSRGSSNSLDFEKMRPSFQPTR